MNNDKVCDRFVQCQCGGVGGLKCNVCATCQYMRNEHEVKPVPSYSKQGYENAITYVAVHNSFAAKQGNPRAWAQDGLDSLLRMVAEKPERDHVLRTGGFIVIYYTGNRWVEIGVDFGMLAEDKERVEL